MPPDPKLVPNLKFVHFFSAGTDHVANTPIYKDTDIPLTTSSGIHGPPITEWVIMQLLAFSHRQKLLYDFQKAHKWGRVPETTNIRDYVGQRLGVLGYGSIGRQSCNPILVPSSLLNDYYSCTCVPSSWPRRNRLYRIAAHHSREQER